MGDYSTVPFKSKLTLDSWSSRESRIENRVENQGIMRLSQRPETFKNVLNFPVELKPLFLERFSGSRTQFQSKRLVMLWTEVCYSWSLSSQVADKPRIVWRYKINILLLVDEYPLFVCIWSRHLKLYLRKWSLIQISLNKHLLYNLNWSFFEHTVACANITMPCCATAVCLYKMSVMGESFVFCSARLYPRLDSR